MFTVVAWHCSMTSIIGISTSVCVCVCVYLCVCVCVCVRVHARPSRRLLYMSSFSVEYSYRLQVTDGISD